jgi:glyoxylase-like metal-dependent hydrolase (beta-lactamase superfamily II)
MSLPVAGRWHAEEVVEPGVVRVSEPHCDRLVDANVFLVKGRDRDLLVDTGMAVAPLRAALSARLDKPLVLVTTHTHVDHVGGHHEFPDAEILVHPSEADALRQPDRSSRLGFEQFGEAMLRGLRAAGFDTSGSLVRAVPAAGFDIDACRRPGTAPTRLISEGDVVDLGHRRFEVLHCPGHSPGSIALFDAADGTLIAGDAVYDGVLVDDIPGADIGDYRRTMQRLLRLPVRIVHGGHNRSFGGDRLRQIAEAYLASRPEA